MVEKKNTKKTPQTYPSQNSQSSGLQKIINNYLIGTWKIIGTPPS